MLNNDGVRELAYVTRVNAIEPIVGSDNCEAAVVGGWRVMTRKGTFKVGDLAIYFEIDSKVPAKEPFGFLEKKHYKVKTQKYTFGGKGNFVSQGLLMHPSDFGWTDCRGTLYPDGTIDTGEKGDNRFLYEGDFLTQRLGVTYAEADDNKRKAKSPDKYKKMAQRRPNIFKKSWAKWFMRRKWGRKLMFLFFGKKKDKRTWPAWVVKTDEERVQNMTWVLNEIVDGHKIPWVATEKLDGTSTTFTMKGYGRKRQFLICSRNVVFDKPDKQCYYETNVYTEMAEKYHAETVLDQLFDYFNDKNIEFITLQGETFGEGIQRRDYGLTEHDFRAFNLIIGYKDGTTIRLNPMQMTEILTKFDVPCVPIIDEEFYLPDTVEELLEIATDKSAIDGGMREGLVFRSYDGTRSFKAVSNEFLIKYHG